jgi:glutamate racemase
LVAAAISRAAPHAHLLDPALGTALRCKELLARSNLSAPTEHRPAIAFHISGDIESFRKSASLHLPDHSSTSRFTALQS